MSARDDAGWVRVGELLQVRRVELASRYKNLALFSRERDIDYRLAWDIENHARTNFRRGTRTSIEVAYGWEPGSIERVLGGGEPVVKGEVMPAREELSAEDAFEEAVLAAPLPYGEKQAAILRHREQARQQLEALGIEAPEFVRRIVRAAAGESSRDGREARGA